MAVALAICPTPHFPDQPRGSVDFCLWGVYISTTPCSTRSAGRCWQGRSQPRPGRWLHRGLGPGPGRSVGPAAASVGLASSRRGPGRLSSGPRPGRWQRWPGPRYPPGVQLCGGPAQGAPWTRAAQLATSAWAVAPSRTWAWSRAIGGAGRGIGGAGQLASWTRQALGPASWRPCSSAALTTSTWARAAAIPSY